MNILIYTSVIKRSTNKEYFAAKQNWYVSPNPVQNILIEQIMQVKYFKGNYI